MTVKLTQTTEGRYDVTVDGELVGEVFKDRASTTHGYANSRLGYTTTRASWSWLTPDNCGDFEFSTRKAAVDSLVDFTQVSL